MGALMRKNGFLFIVGLLGVTAAGVSYAQEAPGTEVRTSGYLMTDVGFLNETEDVTLRDWRDEYFTSLIAGLRLQARPRENFSLVVNPELRSHNIFPIRPGVKTGEIVQRTKYEIYIEEAKASWSLGSGEVGRGQIDFGYMIHVDNPDAKVLGNYMFRSMIYPGVLFTKMNNPGAYLFGLHGGADFFDGRFKNNFFVTSEVQRYPYYDISAAYTGSYSIANILDVGVGINAKSLIPVRPSRTTPKGTPSVGSGLEDNTYKFVPFQNATPIHDASGKLIKTITVAPHPDSAHLATVVIVDTAGNSDPYTVKRTGNGISGLSGGVFTNLAMSQLTQLDGGKGDLYPELHGTNTAYSFAGTVVGGRASLNLMGFFGEENPLGRDALRLYTEFAVLGWKNYPGFYEKRDQRLPVMLGLNLPTFNYLDFLAVEVERYTSQDLPTFDRRAQLNLPQPGTHKGEQEDEWDETRRKKDDLKWVISARRTFGGWGLALQAGTDHTKLMDDGDNDFYNAMTRPDHWYTQVRFFAGIN